MPFLLVPQQDGANFFVQSPIDVAQDLRHILMYRAFAHAVFPRGGADGRPTFDQIFRKHDAPLGLFPLFSHCLSPPFPTFVPFYAGKIGFRSKTQKIERILIRVNIQIFGTRKCFDTKKAERYFKERGIRFQAIDLLDKGISRGELQSVAGAVGGIDALLNPAAKDADTLALVRCLLPEARLEKILENPQILQTPIVRNGRQATVGYCPDVWKTWN